MSYTKRNGQHADGDERVLLGTTAVTASGESSATELGDARVMRLTLEATIAGEDPEVDVTVEGSQTAATGTWYTLGAFTQLTETGSERKCFPGERFVRIAYAIAGEDSGSTSEVEQSGAGPVVTITGTPAEDGDGIITILATDGARGTAEFDWEYGSESDTGVLTAATVVLGTTGLTANFAVGDYVEAEEYTWTGDDPDPDTTATLRVSGEIV
jgi:hypothetical protein